MTDDVQHAAGPRVHLDPAGPALVIDRLTVRDGTVIAESLRWTEGRRGSPVAANAASGTDLSAFAERAIAVGAHAIATAGGVQEAYDLESLVTEVGERTSTASREAGRITGEAIAQATKAMEDSTSAARKAIGEIAGETRRSFSEHLESTGKTMRSEVERLVGGENPELLVRLRPLLDQFGHDLNARSQRQATELIEKVTRQFDPADPTSPMAQQGRALAERQNALSETLTQANLQIVERLDKLAEQVKVRQAAADAAAAAARVSPLKGRDYEDCVNHLLRELAAGFGDEYRDTSQTAGTMSRNKKGDGVLSVRGGDVRIVVEMTDSGGRSWSAYLDEAERNRKAVASLGLVRCAEQLGGHSLLSFGARRLVMAFDPQVDSPDLLRTALQLLRVSAEAAARRQDSAEVLTAGEKVTSALAVLTRIDAIDKSVSLISKHAGDVGTESGRLRSELTRLLGQAQAALVGAAAPEADDDAA